LRDDSAKRSSVQNEEERAEDGTLRNTVEKLKNRRVRILNFNIERLRTEVGFNPVKSSASETKPE